MTTGYLVNRDADESSLQKMEAYYQHKRIPAEKKPFLIDLARCAGPLLAVDEGSYILDVGSQIASLGLGFNAGVMFGACEFQETWTGNDGTPTIRGVRSAFESLLKRLLDWPEFALQLCHSGAEANEIALGLSFERREQAAARRVIAFAGAFHGRTKVALASTWNPQKREPFQWSGWETSFASYPEMDSDDVRQPEIPEGWQALWHDSPQADFVAKVNARFPAADALLRSELESLLQVREFLLSGQHYAILIEPMQCEGGDRYSSARFHHGLINLARSFRVPLIYDEIQTGFALGGDFFWHRKFDLRDSLGHALAPDYVVLAKKAQIGAVITQRPGGFQEQFNPASLIRGYIQASMMDQFRKEIQQIENRNRTELRDLIRNYHPLVSRPRVAGLSFAFDFQDAETLQRFVGLRFQHGLLYYPAGERAARFRFNLAMRGELFDIAWQQIRTALAATLGDPGTTQAVALPLPPVDAYFNFHRRFVGGKLKELRGQAPLCGGADQFLRAALSELGIQADIVFLTESNWQTYRQQVSDLQHVIYEPLRQTEITKFDQLIAAENSIAFAVLKDQKIIAMAFAAPPSNFPKERGVPEDEHFRDPLTVYMLDLSVVRQYQGKLGRVVKQAMCLAAQSKGLQAIQGRNRDRLARGMWAINLSLGSYATRLLKDDYVDDYPFRDCQMYRCELVWEPEPLQLSNGVNQPLQSSDLTEEFCQQNFAAVSNKLTLSNFVTEDYLAQLNRVLELLPESLRHAYTASGMSECVDKLVKSIWLRRQPRQRLVRIGEAFFGHGSFLSRSLSGRQDPLFPVTSLPVGDRILEDLAAELATDQVLAVFLEPLSLLSGVRVDRNVLSQIVSLCQQAGTPLVSQESAGMFYRYSTEAFLPAGLPDFQPDAGVLYLGGQMAVCFMREAWFEETPLMFISTWDGDLLSMAQFDHALAQTQSIDLPALMDEFHERLTCQLARQGVTDFALQGGVGWFRGKVNHELGRLFRQPQSDLFVSCPNVGSIRRFLTEFPD